MTLEICNPQGAAEPRRPQQRRHAMHPNSATAALLRNFAENYQRREGNQPPEPPTGIPIPVVVQLPSTNSTAVPPSTLVSLSLSGVQDNDHACPETG